MAFKSMIKDNKNAGSNSSNSSSANNSSSHQKEISVNEDTKTQEETMRTGFENVQDEVRTTRIV